MKWSLGRLLAGALCVIIGIVILVVGIIAVEPNGENSIRDVYDVWTVTNHNNMHKIAVACNVWRDTKGEGVYYPSSLGVLLDDGIVHDPRIFVWSRNGSALKEGTCVSDYDSMFDRAGFRIRKDSVEDWLPLAWDRTPFQLNYAGTDYTSVVFFDGHTELLSDSVRRRLLDRVDTWIEQNKNK